MNHYYFVAIGLVAAMDSEWDYNAIGCPRPCAELVQAEGTAQTQ